MLIPLTFFFWNGPFAKTADSAVVSAPPNPSGKALFETAFFVPIQRLQSDTFISLHSLLVDWHIGKKIPGPRILAFPVPKTRPS